MGIQIQAARDTGEETALYSTTELLWPSGRTEPDVLDLRSSFCSPLSLHDFAKLWSSWTCTELREWTLLSLCHRWSVPHMFCILISGQDKHKVSWFIGNIHPHFTPCWPDLYLFSLCDTIFLSHLTYYLQSVNWSLCLYLHLFERAGLH